MTPRFRVIGLMSGTSMDGIDAAFIETDGDLLVEMGPHAGIPYPSELRRALLGLSVQDANIPRLEAEVTDLHTEAVRALCRTAGIDLTRVDLVGFHGQTILHEPGHGRTWQLGDGQRMADDLEVPVVTQFRQTDLRHGGQGAPLVPAYHRALALSRGLPLPVALLNIGGVSNVSLVDAGLLKACDCGPGNALIDDWVSTRLGVPYDDGGRIAAQGKVDDAVLASLLSHPYFQITGPKSLDRNAFSLDVVKPLSPTDGAATLTAFTAAAIAAEAARLPVRPREWIVVGGGRYNGQLLQELRTRLAAPVKTAEDYGWAGSAIEAQAFAYLAVRSVLRLPLSWPDTTGVREPVSGGMVWNPSRGRACVSA